MEQQEIDTETEGHQEDAHKQPFTAALKKTLVLFLRKGVGSRAVQVGWCMDLCRVGQWFHSSDQLICFNTIGEFEITIGNQGTIIIIFRNRVVLPLQKNLTFVCRLPLYSNNPAISHEKYARLLPHPSRH